MSLRYHPVPIAAAISVVLMASAQQPPRPDLPKSANQLVQQAIDNELKDRDPTLFVYRLVKRKPEATETYEVAETKDVTISRLIASNGKPLADDQRAKEDARLQRLLTDPGYMRNKQKEQREDDQRTRKMLEALPQAFLYEYAGLEPRASGEVVVLRFKPNPNYDPPSREQQVYRGMTGTLEVALPALRVAKIQAQLFRDVNFGWGILGHLDKGGEFVVEQGRIHDDHWEPTHMVLNFTGKVMMFKSLKIRQDQTSSDYHPVPEMSIAQAIDYLKKQETELARTQEHKAQR